MELYKYNNVFMKPYVCSDVVSTSSYESAVFGLYSIPGSWHMAHPAVHPPFHSGWVLDAWVNLEKVNCDNPGASLALCSTLGSRAIVTERRTEATALV